MTIILVGNFVRFPVMASGGNSTSNSGSGGSIEYKEHFDSLASLLSDYPTLLSSVTFIFLPGDNDPFAGAFSSGAATVIPRKPIPDLFTTRVKRAFASANAEADRAGRDQSADLPGEAIFTSNPTRLSLFGPVQELVLFRDDLSGRLRRNAVRFSPHLSTANAETTPSQHTMDIDHSVEAAEAQLPPASSSAGPSPSRSARLLAKTLLDQGHLAPYPLSIRPVLWDYSSALSLYPIPTALVLIDPEMDAFVVPSKGSSGWVLNPGRLVPPIGRGREAHWVEWDVKRCAGRVKEIVF
jgi:DNA polymerase epsilon subunit 2